MPTSKYSKFKKRFALYQSYPNMTYNLYLSCIVTVCFLILTCKTDPLGVEKEWGPNSYSAELEDADLEKRFLLSLPRPRQRRFFLGLPVMKNRARRVGKRTDEPDYDEYDAERGGPLSFRKRFLLGLGSRRHP
ncbi:hypothetical protein T265_10151 [Opisthorchis viverrini]|uniref:Uncharacterized protein n=1 Tax=Opisthorchis viverrini TaxID=6198 RepID=A0A074ZEB7_OPIVI|nr:hypothetical protein T265_10151 [Opisthorchis viverrini]KER21555.1 hypothetical protein T265_10151 [Opisthorchis viverrini]